MTLIKRWTSWRDTADRLTAQLDQMRKDTHKTMQGLREQLAAAHAETAAAREEAQALRARLDAACESVRTLTLRLGAADVDRLRGENADLLAEVARLRAARPGPTREEYLRERETTARLSDQLRLTEERLQAAVEALESYEVAPVGG